MQGMPATDSKIDILVSLRAKENWENVSKHIIQRHSNNHFFNRHCAVFIDFMTTEILNALELHKGESIGTVNGTVSGTVNDALDQVLEFISKHQGVRANVISQELHIPIRTLRRYLKKLSEDRITFTGSSKTGGYFIKN